MTVSSQHFYLDFVFKEVLKQPSFFDINIADSEPLVFSQLYFAVFCSLGTEVFFIPFFSIKRKKDKIILTNLS